jgi:hypothetical protein
LKRLAADFKRCGKTVVCSDDELGEEAFYSGLVGDEQRVSKRVEKLTPPTTLIA